MWGQKEEASPTKTAMLTTDQPVATPDTSQPPASSTVVNPAADGDRSGRVQARIGKTLKLKGEMTGSEDVYVDGEVEGTVELRDNTLVVGPSGKVRAQVKARSITILGHLEGKVQASERIEIRKTGSLEGDLVTPRIVIEDGAVFRGSIDVLKPEIKEKAPPRVSKHPRSRPPVVAAARPDRPTISTAGSKDSSGS
jgi:cytoskeletal protein CcmA (bactofilin family)